MKIVKSAEVSESLAMEKQAVKRRLEHYSLGLMRIILIFVVAIDLNNTWFLFLN